MNDPTASCPTCARVLVLDVLSDELPEHYDWNSFSTELCPGSRRRPQDTPARWPHGHAPGRVPDHGHGQGHGHEPGPEQGRGQGHEHEPPSWALALERRLTEHLDAVLRAVTAMSVSHESTREVADRLEAATQRAVQAVDRGLGHRGDVR